MPRRPTATPIKSPPSHRDDGLLWWAWQGLNLRPLRCQHSALPLSYTPTRVGQGREKRHLGSSCERRNPVRSGVESGFFRSLEAAVLILGLEDPVDLHHQVLEVERLRQALRLG